MVTDASILAGIILAGIIHASIIHVGMLFSLSKTPESKHLVLLTLAAAGKGRCHSLIFLIKKKIVCLQILVKFPI